MAGGRDVHLRSLTIGYDRAGQTVTPIADLDLYAPSSRVTALVGRSGSGKTSVLSCIGAMLKPKSGTIWVGGLEVTAGYKAKRDTKLMQRIPGLENDIDGLTAFLAEVKRK